MTTCEQGLLLLHLLLLLLFNVRPATGGSDVQTLWHGAKCKTGRLDASYTHMDQIAAPTTSHTHPHINTNMLVHRQHKHIHTHCAQQGPEQDQIACSGSVKRSDCWAQCAADVYFTGNPKVMNQNRDAFLFFQEYRLKLNLQWLIMQLQ